ncbi:2-oxoacid:acceptor oxidoreductase family protein [Dactylosporangium darangshiense]|uniref:2-oxoacid:acceptor oxidoreductase family protein n=1 Tax=Dactylosporangium darangshiense TaxID=579108 RepID=UPI00363F0896
MDQILYSIFKPRQGLRQEAPHGARGARHGHRRAGHPAARQDPGARRDPRGPLRHARRRLRRGDARRPSKAGVVIGDAPLRALPILPSAWSAIFAHHRHAEGVEERLRTGALVVANTPLVDPEAFRADLRVFAVDASGAARAAEAPNAIGFVLLGAYNALTRLVAAQSLVEAMGELLPPYRRQHAAANERALQAGAAAIEGVAV